MTLLKAALFVTLTHQQLATVRATLGGQAALSGVLRQRRPVKGDVTPSRFFRGIELRHHDVEGYQVAVRDLAKLDALETVKPAEPLDLTPWTRSKVGEGLWSPDGPTSLDNMAATLRILDSTRNWRVQAISFGHPAKGDRPASPTMVELRAGDRGRFKYRYFIPDVAQAKKLMGDSTKVMAFLKAAGTTVL